MSNTIIYDFVSEFFPQHKPFWKNLSEEEMAFFNVIPYNENQLKRVLFNPEENIEEVEKFRNKIKDLETILSHRECLFDYYFFNYLSISRFPYYEARFDFIFAEPAKYQAQIKEAKTIKSYMNKIYDFIPEIYRMHAKDNHSRFESVFGKFYEHIDSVTFKSNFEIVEFKRSQLNLIPYFIKYRNSNLISWFVEHYSEETKRIREYKKPVSSYYEFYGLKTNVCRVEDCLKHEVEKRIRELLTKYKYFDTEIEKTDSLFTVRYSAKNSLFGSHCTFKIKLCSLDEDLQKFELTLQEP